MLQQTPASVTTNNDGSLLDLPHDVLIWTLCKFVSPQSLAAMQASCKSLHIALQNDRQGGTPEYVDIRL